MPAAPLLQPDMIVTSLVATGFPLPLKLTVMIVKGQYPVLITDAHRRRPAAIRSQPKSAGLLPGGGARRAARQPEGGQRPGELRNGPCCGGYGPLGMVAHGQDVRLFTKAQQERAVVHQRAEIQRRQRIGQFGERLGAALAMGDQLGDHGIVIGAHLIASGDAGVDAHAIWPVQPVDGAAGGQKTGGHILGVEARLHRMAA